MPINTFTRDERRQQAADAISLNERLWEAHCAGLLAMSERQLRQRFDEDDYAAVIWLRYVATVGGGKKRDEEKPTGY
mgnify:CR=1 FL=1